MQWIIESRGASAPLGFSEIGNKGNFALFSKNATRVTLGLFNSSKEGVQREFAMHRTGDIWHIGLENIPSNTLYSFRCEGPKDPRPEDLFKPELWMADPCAKILATAHSWGTKDKSYLCLAASPPSFDWEGVSSPGYELADLVIYEMHVRGFTQHSSSQVENPGTFLGVLEKIPHLKKLGINAVEFMPIFEFDEIHCKDIQPVTGEPLPNYWGYNTLFFMAPMRRFAANESLFAPINEYKTLIRELHRSGIEVILDVVFNHTGEGNEKNYFINFRGIDNQVYYMVDPQGYYRNFTGCGNTFNGNHPDVQAYILECLRYWIEEMHIDGFRFDLASTFTRDLDGSPIGSAPIVTAITDLCKAKKVKLIAEAWDAAGLYQVGYFPNHWGYWSDWNGKYRDTVRKFIKGTYSQAGAFADAISGSQSIYHDSKTPTSSLNFITAHDGYTLRDLVTYQMKHNYENGEMNLDGTSCNDNWNCGAEGPTLNAGIAALREKQMRNFLLALFLSQGVPMLLMGDEYGHSRKGNNNPFVQDNDLNWFLWNVLEKNEKIFSFVSKLIDFRKKHKILRQSRFLSEDDIQWHGSLPFAPDWSEASRFLAFTLNGETPLYAAFNAYHFPVAATLPSNGIWRQIVNTDMDWNENFFDSLDEAPVLPQQIELPAHSAILLTRYANS